jgi:hypothetical protein
MRPILSSKLTILEHRAIEDRVFYQMCKRDLRKGVDNDGGQNHKKSKGSIEFLMLIFNNMQSSYMI